MIRRYFAGIITGAGDLLGRRKVEPECWWGTPAGGMTIDHRQPR